ncbi:ribosome biogenesis protein NOP53 [Onthophagus taurus]|uniref:ribosome biogenesis protein NOP53 n=1 Tax=Onthophagus taurus TaxID=166361 RepID=UPI0039BDC0DC
MTLQSPGIKKKRISKKKKSSWRKTDIKDVEEFLEDQRLEERLGQPFSTLKDEEFFSIDVAPQVENLTKREKRKIKAAAPPKCYPMLQPHTKVPDPISKRNRVRTKEERKCPILKKKEQEMKLKGILKKKELQRISDRQRSQDKKEIEEENEKEVRDIWDENDGKDDEWIDKLTKRHTLRGVGKLTKVIPRMKNTLNGVLPKVEAPHPGMSYNPSYEDHQDLLKEVADKELKFIKEQQHLDRVTKDIFKKVSATQNEKNWMKEMSQGLPNPNKSENKSSTKQHKSPYESVNPPVVNKKKTLKQRRKIKEQAELKENIKKAKIEKKKIADIYKLKFINSKIEKDEKFKEIKQRKRLVTKKLKQKETKRLGKVKFDEPDLDFNLGQEITGNLRNIKSEGSLLKDRFQSMQKRNILDVTKRHIHKRGKKKTFVKNSFKNWETTVVK